MRFYFKTFGCRVNQYETQTLREKLMAAGDSKEVEAYEDADLCVVNTCTVTREADQDALRLIRRISRRNPTSRLVVTGCFATRAPQEILDAAPSATVVGNQEKDMIPAMLGCTVAPEYMGISGFRDHTRAFIKIQDGCNMHCTYCIVPTIRPKLNCKPIESLEREVQGLVESGVREIVVCGVRLGRYLDRDRESRRVDFVAMLDRLLSLPGEFRIRLSSLEVTDLTDRLIDLLVRWQGRLAPSFHVPLQSGSDPVLKRMERWYSAGFYARRVEALKQRWPDAGLFADVMAGFPSETEAQFEETYRFISGLNFSGLHVFRYSKRPGTPAARFKDQVPEAEILERSHRMRELDQELRAKFAAKAVGSVRDVLIEQAPGRAAVEGVTDHFLRVRFDRDPGLGLVRSKIFGSDGSLALAQRA